MVERLPRRPDVCPHCGAVLRPVEEVLPPAEEPEETVPTDPVEETAQENSPAKGRRRLTGKAKVLIAAAAAAAVALTAVSVVLVRRSSQDTRTPLLFYKDSTLYAVSPVNWNRIIALPAENGDAYLNSAYIQYSRDGRHLYYPDSAGMDSYTLYCCDLFRGSTRMVDDEVVGLYRLTPDGRTAVYCSGEELLCSDPDGKRILAQDVQRFMLAVDGRTVVYQTADRTLYRGSLPSGESTQIGGADDVHYISPEADSAYYVRDYVLYYWKNGGQEQRLPGGRIRGRCDRLRREGSLPFVPGGAGQCAVGRADRGRSFRRSPVSAVLLPGTAKAGCWQRMSGSSRR